MKYEILDKKQENKNTCYLIKSSVKEYISNLPADYDNYDIQRSIVSNLYLDKLVHTVLHKGHIPSIVLVSGDDCSSIESNNISNFKILDGLQRTFRLKQIYDTKILYQTSIKNKSLELSDFQLKRKFREELLEINSSSNILLAIKNYDDEYGEQSLNECFLNNFQWFEVWVGLTPEEEVSKMLILNAGHKPVDIKHQLELLFHNILPIIEDVQSGSITIVKDKDMSSMLFSKGRNLGHYHFSSIISSLISFVEGKAVTTNSALVLSIQENESKLNSYKRYCTYEFIEAFLYAIYSLDKAAHREYKELGTQWFGREVSLVSLFGVIGKISKEPLDLVEVTKCLADNFSKMNLNDYEDCRNNVNLSKVNVGKVNKRYISEGLTGFIESSFAHEIDWKKIFLGRNK
jgi:hypothetical protein